MSVNEPWPIAELLPHAPPLRLLDRLLGHDATTARSEAVLGPDHPFARAGRVGAHVGLELMAQGCGAHVGALARARGEAVRLGFLLGSRDFRADPAGFAVGDRLEIVVAQAMNEAGMGVYDCRIERDGAVVATARLTLYQPEDPAAIATMMRGTP
ncbi:hypothetical protein [Phaeospirillum tilakii]|uniref:3-hydroxylacyl-ACP dehydratase n=1 Tax=Phaeospirillum tilakii TaxID=741673 RepID=A0ABW5C773_9PROT